MSFKEYAGPVTGCSTTVLGAQRVADVVAALTPPADATSAAPSPKPSEVVATTAKVVPGLVGAGVGAVVWKQHRVLGALGGHAVVNAGYEFVRGNQKKAMCQLAVEGSGIAGSLWWKKHPIAGWFAGIAAGAVATYFVKGSPVRSAVQKVKK